MAKRMRWAGMAWVTLMAAAPAQFTTAQPLDTLQTCLRAQWQDAGRVTAINSAAGVVLDFAFDSVGADGKVESGRLTFSVEDRGTQRTVTAAAPNAADDALANRLLAQAVRRCLPDAVR